MCSQRVHEHEDIRRPLFWGRGSSGSGGLRRESRFRQSSTAFQQLSDVIKFSCGIQAAILRVPEELLCDLLHYHGWVSNSHCDHGGGDSHCRYGRRGSGQIDQVNDKSFMGHWKFCDGFKHVQTYPEIIKRSWKTAKKTKPHSQVAIVEAIHRCVGASWQNDDFVVCLCAQSSFASKNTSQIALPISLEFPWLPGWDSGEIGQREVHFVLCGLAAIRGVCTSWKKDFFPTSRLYKTDSNRLNRLKSADIPKLLNWIRAAFWNDRQWRRSRRNVPA